MGSVRHPGMARTRSEIAKLGEAEGFSVFLKTRELAGFFYPIERSP
ncbi:hypothetical protein Q670_11210 [Alcanivorax sp. P2S70]|nr:hypothetical protein Q670_11210 [Alcanivorax sp. P2S70]|tara:strand:- start:1155 stop:1292 length:138 start_codon:yes stop_codon:yes gene_type:complete